MQTHLPATGVDRRRLKWVLIWPETVPDCPPPRSSRQPNAPPAHNFPEHRVSRQSAEPVTCSADSRTYRAGGARRAPRGARGLRGGASSGRRPRGRRLPSTGAVVPRAGAGQPQGEGGRTQAPALGQAAQAAGRGRQQGPAGAAPAEPRPRRPNGHAKGPPRAARHAPSQHGLAAAVQSR